MKKVITILMVMAIVMGAVFADGTPAADAGEMEEILVTCEVKTVSPTFQLYASLTKGRTSAGTGMTEAEKVETINSAATSSLSAKDNAVVDGVVVVYCVIKQAVDARFTGSVTLDVAATALKATVNSTEYKTADPTVSALVAANNEDGVRTSTPGEGSEKKLTVDYTGKKAKAADIASFSVQWAKTDLPPATYNAYITMTLKSI